MYERVYHGYGFGDLNLAGEGVLDFTVAFDFIVAIANANIVFEKRERNTWQLLKVGQVSQIDDFLVRRACCLICKDCKVISESLMPQHRLSLLEIYNKGQYQTRKDIQNPRTKWWNLKGEKALVYKDKIFTPSINQNQTDHPQFLNYWADWTKSHKEWNQTNQFKSAWSNS